MCGGACLNREEVTDCDVEIAKGDLNDPVAGSASRLLKVNIRSDANAGDRQANPTAGPEQPAFGEVQEDRRTARRDFKTRLRRWRSRETPRKVDRSRRTARAIHFKG